MNQYRCDNGCKTKPCPYSLIPTDEYTQITDEVNIFISTCGCASHIGLKREKMLDELVKATKMRIRQLFLDDSKCELCEKIDEADGYYGQNEGCEKGLCIECAIDKALREFAEEIRQQRGR